MGSSIQHLIGNGFCFVDTTVQIEASPAFEDE